MEIVQHLGHDHPLMLIKKEETDDSWDLSCYGCQQPISDSYSSDYYGCKRCRFFLDKTCGELPPKMIHPHHPLTLLPDPPHPGHNCDVCTRRCNRFIYCCSRCDYDIDVRCASLVLSIQQSIEHKSHPHQLVPLQMESTFFCNACGEQHKGFSFLCTTCGFWINQKCASSPRNIKLNNHHHTLLLIYVISSEDYLKIGHFPVCQICSKNIYRRNWLYCCSECRYFVHIHCAASEKENYKTETENHDLLMTATSSAELSGVHTAKIVKAKELDPDLIYLPVPNDSVDITTKFIKNFIIQGKCKEAAEIKHVTHDHPLTKIKHVSHDHQLTYFEKPIDHASCSKENNLSFLNGTRNDEKCSGCAQSISGPFYRCVECKFFLHVWCAQLPEELRHPCHPQHKLVLTASKYSRELPEVCNCCYHSSMLFPQYECRICDFFTDRKCAFLPRVIKHESHKHTLFLRPISSCICISCSDEFEVSFECGSCKFNVCILCACLPGTVRHRYDKHPFNLTYSPLPYETEDDFCEICEEGIDSKRWFYHCDKCNQSLHTKCIFPFSKKHPHRLTSVQVQPIEDFSCSICKRNKHCQRVYICSQCKFGMCYFCFCRFGVVD